MVGGGDWWGSVGTKLHEDDRDVHMECFVSPHKLFSLFSNFPHSFFSPFSFL